MSVSAREVIQLIDEWHPRKCETEKDFERSLHKHLEKNLEKCEVASQYAAGRVKGDIVIDGEILIEVKDSLKSTGQLRRLLGQLDIHAAQWKGKVIVVICGRSQRDLLKRLNNKIESLKPRPSLVDFFPEQKIFLVARGSPPPPSRGPRFALFPR